MSHCDKGSCIQLNRTRGRMYLFARVRAEEAPARTGPLLNDLNSHQRASTFIRSMWQECCPFINRFGLWRWDSHRPALACDKLVGCPPTAPLPLDATAQGPLLCASVTATFNKCTGLTLVKNTAKNYKTILVWTLAVPLTRLAGAGRWQHFSQGPSYHGE